jgi:hypothetical protein
LNHTRIDNPAAVRHNPGMAEAPNDPIETPLVAETSEERPCYEGTPFLGNYQPPRLGIIHLLAWVTVAAILMKFNLAIETFRTNLPDQSENFRLAMKIFDAVHAIYHAAMLVGGTVLLLDRFRRKPGRLQPGHWIVGIQSLFILAFIFANLLNILLQDSHDYGTNNFLILFYAGIDFLISLALLGGSFRLLEPLRWKWCLGCLGLQSLFFCVHYLSIIVCLNSRSLSEFLRFFDNVAILVLLSTALFVLIVMIVDIIKGCRRDWLHWLGAIHPLFLAAFSLSWRILSEILQRHNQ